MEEERRRILVVEDDPLIADLLDLNLQDEGFSVTLAQDGADGFTRLQRERFDLLVLDLMLPGMDGLEICRLARTLPHYTPIIIISAKSAEAHRILGLELGADDYVTKPFSVLELIARVRALFRRIDSFSRAAAVRAGSIERDGLLIDPLGREVQIKGKAITLTPREFDLLYFFARHPGRAFTRLQLLEQVWGYGHDGYEHTVNSHINRLRSKIERDPARPEYILTVWGIGYKFTDASHRLP